MCRSLGKLILHSSISQHHISGHIKYIRGNNNTANNGIQYNSSQEHGTETKSSVNVKQAYLEQSVTKQSGDNKKYCFVS